MLFCVTIMFVPLLQKNNTFEIKSYSKQLNNNTYYHFLTLTYVFLYMYKQNDEQTLMHAKVTLGEHETKSLHLCQIRSNYIESDNLGRKSCPVSGIERIRYSECFITLKLKREIFGTDEIVRFHGDSGIKRIRLRGFVQ